MNLLRLSWACGLVSTIALAQSLSPSLDPTCGLPRVTLQGARPNEAYEIQGSDDLGAPGVWETLLQLAPSGHDHTWFDPSASEHGRRFYRLTRLDRIPEVSASNFALNDQNGVRHELFREGQSSAVVLVFTDNASLPEAWAAVKPLQAQFSSQGVQFWLVNPRDSRAALVAASQAAGVEVPVLHDVAQLAARTFNGARAFDVTAISAQDIRIFYQGALADRCDTPAGPREQTYLADALKQFLAGDTVVVPLTKSRGPSLELAELAVPDYSREIAPILQAKCVTCHRPGDIGSYAMTAHAEVALRARSIRSDVLGGHMPPWHADPGHGQFSNDSSLTPSEAARLVAWIDAGSPRGGGDDPLVTQPPPPVADWPLGTPDLVLSIPTQSLPATGQIDYRYLIVNNPLKTNVWLRAATVKPGNREVVHHSLVFTAKTASDFLQVQGGLGGFFAGYVPGADPVEFPAGTGKQLKAGNYLIFQMHYTPNGKATTDRTQIGLYFASAAPARELTTTAAFNTQFVIPPGAKDQEAVAETTVDRDSLLYEMSPHMHYRGARMRFEAIYPNGTSETLLNVPGYEFAWQTLFRLAQPKLLPSGTRIRVTGGFDNSEWNPWNPDPGQTVTFGEQTSDEMLIGYLNLAPQ